MRLTTRILLGFSLVGTLAAIAGLLALVALDPLDPLTGPGQHIQRSSRLATALQSDALALGRAVAARDPEAALAHQDARRRIQARLDELRAAELSPGDQPEADPASQTTLALSALDRVAADLEAGRFEEATRQYLGAAEPRTRQAIALLTGQSTSEWERLGAAVADRAAWRRRLAAGAAAVGLIGLLTALGLGLGLGRGASRPIAALTRRAEMLAEGDLIAPTPAVGTPEVGALARAIAGAIDGIRLVIGQVRDALVVIAASSGQFVHSAQQYAAGSQQQAAAVEEISRTMERLSAAAEQIATGASRATEAAADGRAAVDQTASGVAAIRDAVQVASARGASLRLGSNRVGEVADAISAIAERTHILALNAAIEASTAGEYGRRFGVVAGQVRDLAGDTRRATEQVKATVSELREAIVAVEASGAEASAVASRVDDQAQRAAAAIADMVAVVETIARATVSQYGASAELVRTMREIVDVARESAESSRLAASEAAQLNTTAAQLERVVERFRLAAPPRA